ncbi:hypothetical protein ACFPES_19130 [Paenibacillus sp. GCM10023248]|uniref:hypothetical protein n=1 Tax=Bacillales TaxID=1385 RepID=UPI0023791314|nr:MULTISPECIES: hypothetical protein [Bacillales]MDD9269164.1 hypothetical protein [Paenibacillus sp. MAHUQ-63]MDR6880616.1 hypothetical protein [Bacillus sp. 3255]
MKRFIALCLIGATVVTVAACSKAESASAPAGPIKMLYLKRGEGTNDPYVVKHFEKKGYTVIDMADNVFKSENVKGYNVVYVSPTVNSSRIDAQLKQSAVPVVYAKPQVAGISQLTGLLDYNELSAAKTVQIKDSKHPLAAGLKDQVAVYKNEGKIGYALPGKEATTIATVPGDDKKAVVFGYEKGVKNLGNEPVPARQVFFYLSAGEEMNQTDDGFKLLDAAIEWAAKNGSK